MDADGAELVVVTADAEVRERVLAVTATLGVQPELVPDASQLRPAWARAPLALVGVDLAAEVAAMVLPRRRGVLLVGLDQALSEVCAWSVPLGAAVLSLPSGAERLAGALAEVGGRQARRGRLVAVVGGAGGVGSSTYAAALAVVGARPGSRTALIDLDEHGGGIDLLVGAEGTEGWRWPRFSGARGFLGDLHGQLPHLDGLDVLSVARDAPAEPAGLGLGTEQLRAVLLSVTRTHDLVVVDLPRVLTPACRETLRQADEVLLVVRADLRGVAAARQMLQELLPACTSLRLLVRGGRVRGVPVEAVAEALGLPCAGTVPDDAALALAAERGDPPGRSSRSALARSCRRLLAALPQLGEVA